MLWRVMRRNLSGLRAGQCHALRFAAPAAIAVLALVLTGLAQMPATLTQSQPTELRVRATGWWPTKRTAARGDFLGPESCTRCHASIAAMQQNTDMRLTSMAGGDSALLRANTPVRLQIGPYTYEMKRSERGAEYSVSNRKQTIAEPLAWAFGDGSTGQSYVIRHNGSFYEGRMSYFTSLKEFGLTPNHPTAPAATLEKSFGRRLNEEETLACFGCHTTASTTVTGFDPARLMHGVTCEACHGPGADHVALREANLSGSPDVILNPARLTPVDSVDFCGACHRTWWDAKQIGMRGPANVRFPPYRLEQSRCWGKGDVRITCIACHDPHRPLVHEAAAYDEKCLTCHANRGTPQTGGKAGAACPKATSDCVSCHMPKYDIPGTHLRYTDHRIRVVRAGEAFPD